jgi:eukaryotic-like serine/threonine-protein kinase
MDEPVTKSLERYDVLDRIAVGGMAEVFLAKAYGAHGFEKTLAIKRILPELARDPEFEARFIAEAKVAVRLSHANVVQVLDFGRIGESLFIAMEYVDGLDLAAMLRKFKDEKRLLPLPAAFHIAIEIIRALDFAHGHNVVHRDVSPSNVLVSRAGEVKLADFGIAVAARPHKGGGPGPRKVMGKWRYMSPEQTRGDTLDTRSDLFSAASVIYEVFTGEKLFPGEEAEEIIKNIHEMPIPKMTALRPQIPSRLDEVLAMALARKPIDRPSRPATVLRSLIELSYESSIMATALDVAEALATVVPAKRMSGRGALDDVIRKQLHEQSVARRTAVTDGKPPATETAAPGDVSTGLFRKVDVDGLSRLEEVEATRVAAPRARRNSEQGEAMPGDTDVHALYELGQDKDRFTEVGGPPTGQVPKLGASADKLPVARPAVSERSGPRRTWLALALAVVAAGLIAVWVITRGQSGGVAQAAPEAGVALAKARLMIDSDPEGAEGWVEVAGDPGTRTVIPKLAHDVPFAADVRPNEQYRVHLELRGHTPYDDVVTITPGETLRLRPKLVPAPARLDVVTDPPGAQVTLAGRVLGESPRLFDDLAPAQGQVVTLQKSGYVTVTRTIDLVAGEITKLEEQLRAEDKFGTISVELAGSTPHYGDLYFNGRLLGINWKLAGGSGLVRYKLPVGPGTLKVVNKAAGKSVTMQIVVLEGHKTFNVTW